MCVIYASRTWWLKLIKEEKMNMTRPSTNP